MKLFWIILLSAWLISLLGCTPQQRLNSIIKKHPELSKKKIESDSGVIFPKDLLDEHDDLLRRVFLIRMANVIDSIQGLKNQSDKEKIIERVIEKNIPQYLKAEYPDTTLTLGDGTKLRIFFDDNGRLHFKESHPEQIFNVTSETWWEKTERRLFKWLLVIVLAVVGVFVFIMLTGSGLKILESKFTK